MLTIGNYNQNSREGWVFTDKILCDGIISSGKLSNVAAESQTLISPMIVAPKPQKTDL